MTLMRARARRAAIAHRAPATAVAGALRAVGAGGAADALLRVRDDVASVRLPVADGDRSPAPLRLRLHGGRDHTAVALARYGWAGFERPMPEVLLSQVRHGRGGVMVDVGANTGFYSALAAVGDRRVSVHSFEPLPGVREVLEDNCVLNRITRRVHVHPVAVGAVSGQAVLYVPPPAGDQPFETSASLSPDFKDTIELELTVDVVTLDSWYHAQGRPRVTVVKVDVESRELDVLRGAADLLREQRPVVFYELLPQGDAHGITALAAEHRLVDVQLSHPMIVVGEPVRFEPAAWNHVLVPSEQLGEWLERTERLGLGVRRSA